MTKECDKCNHKEIVTMTFEKKLKENMATYKYIPPNIFIFKEVVEEFYISKQRVRDAIEKKLKFLNYILEKDDYNLGYIFIKAIMLDKYLEKVIKDLKIVFLVK